MVFKKKLVSCYNVYQLSIALLFNTDVIFMYNKQKFITIDCQSIEFLDCTLKL